MPESASVFYAGKTVLVTGHTGFKGGWLAAWLQLLGAEVVGFALPPDTEPNLYTVADIGERMATTFGDVRDAAAVAALCARHRPGIIITDNKLLSGVHLLLQHTGVVHHFQHICYLVFLQDGSICLRPYFQIQLANKRDIRNCSIPY